jgi:hypothetical protein
LIDSKGRLLGVVNLLDLLVMMIIAMLAATAVMNFAARPKAENKTSAEVLIKAFCRVPSEVAHNAKILKPGDKVFSGNGIVERVLDVKPVANDTGYSDMVILIRAKCVILNNEYYCANAVIKVNSSISISNPQYIFNNSTILDVEKKVK